MEWRIGGLCGERDDELDSFSQSAVFSVTVKGPEQRKNELVLGTQQRALDARSLQVLPRFRLQIRGLDGGELDRKQGRR